MGHSTAAQWTINDDRHQSGLLVPLDSSEFKLIYNTAGAN
jgi:hypothetical protein